MPPLTTNAKNETRRVGFELEFSGLTLTKAAGLLMKDLGGRIEIVNPYHFKIADTPLGTFTLVLDFQFLIESGLEKWLHSIGLDQALEPETVRAIESFIADISETVVPYEVSTPPLPLERLETMERVREVLRKNGAIGTKADPFYAFGFHINPEAARITAPDILDTLRAFFILYDYLVEVIKPDFTRRLTPYIDPFDTAYIERVLDMDYDPTMPQLIDDYLAYNPTRNRALDLLPLFAWIDVDRVMAKMEGEKISARPTWHYRLPNSRVDEPEWCTCDAWNSWVLVERLAADEDALRHFQRRCLAYLGSPLHFFKKEAWIDEVEAWVGRASS
ncbi:amidoligase family protein [Hydrogenimonas sp. SS33]|uniref:amidoligase family protein n=1 Tax=Hydrogenimonas leucolamina TaxID=2954236 RepID=UPI00336C2A43